MKKNLIDSIFKKNAIFNYGFQLVGVLAGFAYVTLVTRFGGIDTYGKVVILVNLSGFLGNLLTFRTNEAVVKFYRQGQVTGDVATCKLALLGGLLLDFGMGLFVYFLMHAFSGQIAELLLKNSDYIDEVRIFSLFVVMSFLRGTGYGVMVAEEKFVLSNALSIAEQVLKVLLVLAVVLMKDSLDLFSVVSASLLASSLITLVFVAQPLKKILVSLRSVSVPFNLVGEYIRFSISTFASTSLKAGTQNIDSLMVGYFVSPTGAGLLAIFKQFLAPIAMLAAPFSVQIYPRFVQSVTNRRFQDVRMAINKGNWILIRGFLVMLLVIIPALYSYFKWNELPITNKDYITFGMLALATIIIQSLWWARGLFLAVNPAWSLESGALSLILTVVLGWNLIQAFQVQGAALTSVITACIMYVYGRYRLNGIG